MAGQGVAVAYGVLATGGRGLTQRSLATVGALDDQEHVLGRVLQSTALRLQCKRFTSWSCATRGPPLRPIQPK